MCLVMEKSGKLMMVGCFVEDEVFCVAGSVKKKESANDGECEREGSRF